jgi:hypothetical protein
VKQDWQIRIVTEGDGTGCFATLNEWMGPRLFNAVNQRTKEAMDAYLSSIGGWPPPGGGN